MLKSFAEGRTAPTSIGDLQGDHPGHDRRRTGVRAAPLRPREGQGGLRRRPRFSATGPTTLESLLAGEIQVADIYSADPAFQTEDIVALEDPENIILASNVADRIERRRRRDLDVINAVSKKLTAEELVALNVQSTVDQKSAEDIAKKWLSDNDLS